MGQLSCGPTELLPLSTCADSPGAHAWPLCARVLLQALLHAAEAPEHDVQLRV